MGDHIPAVNNSGLASQRNCLKWLAVKFKLRVAVTTKRSFRLKTIIYLKLTLSSKSLFKSLWTLSLEETGNYIWHSWQKKNRKICSNFILPYAIINYLTHMTYLTDEKLAKQKMLIFGSFSRMCQIQVQNFWLKRMTYWT